MAAVAAHPANPSGIANLVANYKFTQRVSISLTSQYSTGRPITYPLGVFNMGGAAVANYVSILERIK